MRRRISISAALGMNRRFGDASLNADDLTRWMPEDSFDDWEREARAAADFAWLLVDTDAYSCGLLGAMLSLTLGTSGLPFRSQYQADELSALSDDERWVRARVNRWIQKASSKFNLDCSGQFGRLALERLLAIMRHVTGDGFAVRLFMPARRNAITSNCWRIIGSDRVCNPTGVANWSRPNDGDIQAPEGHRIWEGIELDADDQPAALWIKKHSHDSDKRAGDWVRVEWYGPDGMANVIHRFDPIKPDMLRGFSDFAPIYITAKHLRGVSEAHLVGKRAQACHPIAVTSTDEQVAANFASSGAVFGPHVKMRPGMIAFLGDEGGLHTPNWSYQGDDFASFVQTQVRAMAATKGIPWQYVLCHVEGVSMSSGRIFIDRAREAGEMLRHPHILQVTSVIDDTVIAEGLARGLLTPQPGDIYARKYLPPRMASVDKSKEADAAIKHASLGRPLDAIHAEFFGEDFEENILAAKQCMQFLEMHGVTLPEVKLADDDAEEPDDTDDEDPTMDGADNADAR